MTEAERLEYDGKLGPLNEGEPGQVLTEASGGAMEDALAALAVLGYPRAVAVGALQGVDTAGMATDEIVRAALKRLF